MCLGGPLGSCSERPVTGFFRDGCCNTSDEDVGRHTVCVVLTADFLAFSQARGNDPVDAAPGIRFPGLAPATAGACVPPAGAKPGKRAWRRAWC